MVTTLKNSRAVKWTLSSARFVRQTPSEKQTESPNRLQSFYRARYYDVTTGEFTSRDPLEYVDGMSLYRGYFVPSDIDPFGEETWEECYGKCAYGGKIGPPTPEKHRDCIRLCNSLLESIGACAKNGEGTSFYSGTKLVGNKEICDLAIASACSKIEPCLDEARKKCEDQGMVFEITEESLSESTDVPKVFGVEWVGWFSGDDGCKIKRKPKISGGREAGTFVYSRIRKTVEYKCVGPQHCPE